MTENDLMLLAFEKAPVGIVMTEYRVIVACNETFCDLSQYSKEDLVGQSFELLYANKREFNSVRDIGLASLAKRGSYSDQRILNRRDGTPVWCRFRAHTLTPDEPLSQTVLSYANLGSAQSDLGLTARERDVVSGLTRSMTSKEIALELGLSPRTVEDVRSRLLKKFNVRTAQELLWHFVNVEI